MKEIERKFLVKSIDNISLESYYRKTIIQDYLYNDKITTSILLDVNNYIYI